MYLPLPRRFRPKTFREVVGQDPIVTTLKNALKMGRVAQAYLFCGGRGTGKTTLARLLAKAMNCNALSAEGEPCTTCTTCVEIGEGRSLDMVEIDGASSRGIDDIRQLNETVGYAPAHGKFRIFLIDEVHMLTKEAFNALLKTLEEPPPTAKFLFATTEPHKVLATIASRCQRFDLQRIDDQALIAKLRGICTTIQAHVEEEALLHICERADGSLRDAESLLDQLLCFGEGHLTMDLLRKQLGLVPRELFFELDQAIHESRLPFALELTDKLYNSSVDPELFLEELGSHFRRLLQLKFGKTPKLLSPKEAELYAKAAHLYTLEQCLFLLDLMTSEWTEIIRSFAPRAALEALLLKILRSRGRLPLDEIARRMLALEERLAGAPAPVKEEAAAPKEEPAPVVVDKLDRVRTETLMQFAAVELEGTIER